jgi:hypothetical protein
MTAELYQTQPRLVDPAPQRSNQRGSSSQGVGSAPSDTLDGILETAELLAVDAHLRAKEAIAWLSIVSPPTSGQHAPQQIQKLIEEIREVRRVRRVDS